MSMQSALELSTPAREPLGIWLPDPCKAWERSGQSLTSKAYSLGRTFEKASGSWVQELWGRFLWPANQRLFCFLCLFSVYEVSPTPLLSLCTYKPEEDTFGVSHFWAGRGQCLLMQVVFRLYFKSSTFQAPPCLEL